MTVEAQTAARGIKSSGLTRRFGDTLALAPLDLEIDPGGEGTIVGLLGPNGSGKSTFMRILTGLVRPDAGTARVDGIALDGDGTSIRRRVTYSPGELRVPGEMIAGELLAWLLRGRENGANERAKQTASALGLDLRRRVRGFSHGMKRQLLFAAAMAPEVRVRILDEPTEGLDPTKRGEVLDLMAIDAAKGTTILLSSHHLDEVDRACGRLVFMNEGKKIADETAVAVRERAARIVRVTWPEDAPLDGIETQLAGPGIESVRRDEARVTVMLEGRDPRPFLAQLARHEDLPAPLAIEHGRLSLRELYRELYGVEGC